MEQTNMLNEFNYAYASKGQRIANYLIDVLVYYAVLFVIGNVLGYSGAMDIETSQEPGAIYYLFAIGLFLLYFTLLEGAMGKTIGKMITKTKVVTATGGTISYGQAFLRTLCRFVPFEFISIFIDDRMWHGKWTKTIVMKDI